MLSRPPIARWVLVCTGCVAALAWAGEPATAPSTQPAAPVGLDYVFSKLADPDPAIREQALMVCRMTSAAGVDRLQHDLQNHGGTLPADTRAELQTILDRQHAVRRRWADQQVRTAAWRKQYIYDAYDRVGSHNRTWDEPVKSALHLYFEGFTSLQDERRLYDLLDDAAKSHCDDPLMMFVRTAFCVQIDQPDRPREIMWWKTVKSAMDASRYPASRKLLTNRALIRLMGDQAAAEVQAIAATMPATVPTTPPAAQAASQPSTTQSATDAAPADHVREAQAQINAVVDAMIAELPAVAAEGDVTTDTAFSAALDGISAAAKSGIDRKQVFDRFNAVLSKLYPDRAELLGFGGQFLIDYAWEARGGGWANEVTDLGWKLFEQRLNDATVALTAAWTKDPNAAGGSAAARMIVVCMGRGARQNVRELWFRRALEANPDNDTACENEVQALDPRWIGNQGLIQLAHLSRVFELSQNDESEIPLLVSMIQGNLAYSTVYSDGKTFNHEYFSQPQVWDVIDRAYRRRLTLTPAYRGARNHYIRSAAAAGRWDVVRQQLTLLLGRPSPDSYVNDYDDFLKVWKLAAEAPPQKN